MITLTITSDNGESFTVRFQSKRLQDGALVWFDEDVKHALGQSERYGLGQHNRLIVQADDAIPVEAPNA